LQGFSVKTGPPLSVSKCDDIRGLAAIRALLAKKCLTRRAISNQGIYGRPENNATRPHTSAA